MSLCMQIAFITTQNKNANLFAAQTLSLVKVFPLLFLLDFRSSILCPLFLSPTLSLSLPLSFLSYLLSHPTLSLSFSNTPRSSPSFGLFFTLLFPLSHSFYQTLSIFVSSFTLPLFQSLTVHSQPLPPSLSISLSFSLPL